MKNWCRLIVVVLLIFYIEPPKCLCSSKAATRKYLLNKPQCNEKTMKRIEMNVAKMIAVGKQGRPFPENEQELGSFCRETTRLNNEIEAFFKNCYQREVRDNANLLIYSIKSSLRRYCGKKRTKAITDLLQVASCANREVRTQIPCMEQFINDTKPLIYIDDHRNKIPYTCCNYVHAVRCVESYLDKVPCIGNRQPIILDFVRGLTQGLINVLCGEYNETTDQCDILGRPPKPKKMGRTKYSTFAFVLVDLLESIPKLDRELQ
ncbi:hypothetical protein BLOT_003576 [Blomia tropicalis]|nr:hypothetical protein BLOT_003576 [Blomia tropicalis]